jgi:hypothetical protein
VIQQLNRAGLGLGADDSIEARLDKLEALLDRADGSDTSPWSPTCSGWTAESDTARST